jgi:pimeloyl-ACP methyl ester carboxylesterase
VEPCHDSKDRSWAHSQPCWTLLTAGLLLVGSLVWWLQPKLMFRPFPDLIATPGDWGMAFDEVTLTTSDGVRLHAWFLPARQGERRTTGPNTLLFLHGNAGNISYRSESLAIFHAIGLDVLILDYRGYGQSEGSPGEAGLYRDASAGWRWLREQRGLSAEEIVIFGRSLGGAVATELAARVQPGALIVESSFTEVRSVAKLHHPVARTAFPAPLSVSVHPPPAGCPQPRVGAPQPGRRRRTLRARSRVIRGGSGAEAVLRTLVGGHNAGFLESQPGYQQAITAFLDAAGAGTDDAAPLSPSLKGPGTMSRGP